MQPHKDSIRKQQENRIPQRKPITQKSQKKSKDFELNVADLEQLKEKIRIEEKASAPIHSVISDSSSLVGNEAQSLPILSGGQDKDEEIRERLLDLSELETLKIYGCSTNAQQFFKLLMKVGIFMEEQDHEREGKGENDHLLWNQRNGLYLNKIPVCVDFLVLYLIEDLVFLFREHGKKFCLNDATIEEEEEEEEREDQEKVTRLITFHRILVTLPAYLLRILEFLSQPEICKLLREKVLTKLAHLRVCKKDGQYIARAIKDLMRSILLDLLTFGLYQEFIEKNDIELLMGEPQSYLFLKDLFSLQKYVRLSQLKSPVIYLPWIVVVKKFLLEFSLTNEEFLEDEKEFTKTCVRALIKWFTCPSKNKFITWLFQFFFRDCYSETKRQFLFIHGKTDSGKTSFMQMLLCDTNFQTECLSTQYFPSYKKGSFDLHCILFDDPTPLLNDNDKTRTHHLLDTEFFLNLAKYTQNNNVTIGGGEESNLNLLNYKAKKKKNCKQQHIVNVKNGYMLINKGQICLLSNNPEERLFHSNCLDAMKTRLLKMNFDEGLPFPLIYASSRRDPFIFKMLDNIDIELLLASTIDRENYLNYEPSSCYSQERNKKTLNNNNDKNDIDDEEGEEEEEKEEDPSHSKHIIQEPRKNCDEEKNISKISQEKETKDISHNFFRDEEEKEEQSHQITFNQQLPFSKPLRMEASLFQSLHNLEPLTAQFEKFTSPLRTKKIQAPCRNMLSKRDNDDDDAEEDYDVIKKRLCIDADSDHMSSENLTIKHPKLTQQLCSYYTWLAILAILEFQIMNQEYSALEFFIPNINFRQLLLKGLRETHQSLNDILQTISDEQLEVFVTSWG